jgi:hypothetical protein
MNIKNNKKKTAVSVSCLLAVVLLSVSGCQKYLDREPLSDYLSSNFYNNEKAIEQGTNGVYQRLKMDYGSSSNIPLSVLWDMYTPFGIERADNSSIGVGNVTLRTNFTVEQNWAIIYQSVARCNTVLNGAAPFYDKLNQNAKILLAEVQTLRAYFYMQLVSLYGDVPYYTSGDAADLHLERTPWSQVVDSIIENLDEAATVLPWKASEYGRVDKSVALGLKSRICLYAGSWDKFGFGMDAVKNEQAANGYFQQAADAARRVIDESGRSLAHDYNDLFTRVGQLKADVKNETMLFMMFSDFGDKSTHYLSLGEASRVFGQSGRFPTEQLVDTYEMANGKRIDEPGSGYDPQNPFANRDPRLRYSIYTQHDTIIGNSGNRKVKFLMEIYKPTTRAWDEDGNEYEMDNADYVGAVAQYGYVQSGVGFLWRKYDHFDDEAVATPTYNILIMRYAEVLLNYAEAKIELNQLDGLAANAIDQVRARVGMPSILTVDPSRQGNQLKMRQIVRRERKVEFARESLYFFDMRRWRIGDLQNAEPTYGYPLAQGVNAAQGIYPDGYQQATADMVPGFGAAGSRQDLNDVPSYQAFASKLRSRDKDRSWNDRFYVWPIPQTERNKAPWLTQNEGYGQ